MAGWCGFHQAATEPTTVKGDDPVGDGAVRPSEAYFWGTHGGAQLDLFFTVNGRRHGVEVKFSEAPTVTRSMRTALEDLSLDHLWIVHPGRHRYPADQRITAWPLEALGEWPAALRARVARKTRTASS